MLIFRGVVNIWGALSHPRMVKEEGFVTTRWSDSWPFDPLFGGHLTILTGHLTIPKRSQRIARYIIRPFLLGLFGSAQMLVKIWNQHPNVYPALVQQRIMPICVGMCCLERKLVLLSICLVQLIYRKDQVGWAFSHRHSRRRPPFSPCIPGSTDVFMKFHKNCSNYLLKDGPNNLARTVVHNYPPWN